jgi:nicotinamidase-related amidase
MKQIAAHAVCETLGELVAPRSTALVLVDLQNDFVSDDGIVARRGEGREAKLRSIVANTATVLHAARERGVTVAYVRYGRTLDHRYESAPSLRWTLMKRGYAADAVSAVEGTWGAEIVADLAPGAAEIVIDKRRASGFFGTELQNELKARSIRTVILAGVSTHGCVESTARDAELRDYYVVVLEDCVGAYSDALHQAALTVMRSRYEVVSSGAVLDEWLREGK